MIRQFRKLGAYIANRMAAGGTPTPARRASAGPETPTSSDAPPPPPETEPDDLGPPLDESAFAERDAAAHGPEPAALAPSTADHGLVVIPARPASVEAVSLAGKSLPSIAVRDPAAVVARLSDFAPHLDQIAQRIVGEAASHPYARFRPLLLVGPRGSGKKRFAKELCAAMGLYAVMHRCGVADQSFAGTVRNSIPLQAVLTSRTANPCIILENLARTDSPSLTAAILDLTDGRSAQSYRDPGQDQPVDLSRLLWIATCQDTSRVPRSLLDRFRRIDVPSATPECAPALIRTVAGDLAEEDGLDRRWATVYSDSEIDMIAEAWGGGSLYRLRSLMRKVSAAVEGMDRGKLN